MSSCRVVNIEIPFSASCVRDVRNAIAELAESHSFSKNQIDDIMVAVGEACTNAVKHGSKTQDHPAIKIRCSLKPYEISISVSNSCDSDSTLVIPSEPDTENENGYGLYLIDQLMDSVRIKHTANQATVVMTKRLKAC